ncbi:MAG: DEAD/DEAH box helicase [Microgenomates group bacterium]
MYNNSKPSSGFKNFGSNTNYRSRAGGSSGGTKSWFKRGPAKWAKPKKAGFGEYIDTNLFIRKATPVVKIEETITVNSFADFGMDATLLANVVSKGYIKPTPIQDQTIPEVMKGRDVLGIANTGTGKTAAFALPLINEIIKNPNKKVIILAPTRELAMQIRQEFRTFTPNLKVYMALAIGGAFIREQIIDIRRGPHIIIGTPGRIKDLGQRKVIDFTKLNTVVLDEVDRMLDMGFIEDIRHIMNQIPKTRQTLFFSATTNKKVEVLIDTLLTDPVKVSVKTQDSSSHVEQNIVQVPRHEKENKLQELLAKEEFKKVLVFGATQMMVERISVNLSTKGFKVASLHGGKPQNKRQAVVRMFKENVINILVATDVAARGLDIADITHVINFDKPNNYDDYCHRIGRTGRGDAMGYALTFVDGR